MTSTSSQKSGNNKEINKQNVPEIRYDDFEGDWEEKYLKDACIINPKTEIPEIFNYIDLESVNSGILTDTQKINKKDAPSRAQRKLDKQDILFATVRPYQQNNYYFNLDGTYVASTGYAQIKANENSQYLYYFLHTKQFLKEVMKRCTGTSYPAINSNDLKTIKIKIPSNKEQEKIASLLSYLDQKIELMEKTNKNYQRVLKYYIHKLLEIGDKEHDQLIQIKDCIIESKEKNLNGLNLPIISSTLDGIFLQSDYFDNDSVAIDVTKYKIIPRNYFTYRSMSDTGIFKFNIQNLYERALVSSAYPVFKVKSEINSDYFKYYLNYSNMMKKQLYINKEGGTRYALSISKFKKMNIILPSSKVQTKISNVINSLNKKYEINNKKLHYLKQFKKGLLQKMFC